MTKAFNVIESCQHNAKVSVDKVSEVPRSLSDIQQSITTISEMAEQISATSEEQVVVSESITQSISEISAATDESVTYVVQISKGCINDMLSTPRPA